LLQLPLLLKLPLLLTKLIVAGVNQAAIAAAPYQADCCRSEPSRHHRRSLPSKLIVAEVILCYHHRCCFLPS